MVTPISLFVYSRDRHPLDHCSFEAQGGPWPPHCVDGTQGFAFHPDLTVLSDALIVDKATRSDREAYSDFDSTGLAETLRAARVTLCVVAGLATDFCVRATVLDAIREGFETVLATDAIAAVDVEPGAGDRALLEMRSAGALLSNVGRIGTMLGSRSQPTALLLVDLQNDFFPGGALPVAQAPRVLGPVNELLRLARRGGA